MADINVSPAQRRTTSGTAAAGAEPTGRDPAYELIELMFFAYRDFVGDPDHVLERYQFGRAHHRVLHFVFRHPEIRVADLLDILKITKQSLARVLKELVEQGFILQKEGQVDRRQRLLAVTEKGRVLALELAKLQTERFARAIAQSGTTRDQAVRFLYAMIDPEGREDVTRMITQADRALQRGKER
ncbi:MAG: MarR family winged helix-turn-helix transcriptional regulator [Phreatobacter sp.]|jgi:DNA-binding MarR family transcriptional regulator|uniref:MarR family winged helix-turn-helix transcriptional regulator n=1 Tax=Phreatobacter sp. TaxID=1966341 RepID=UPI004036F27A